MKYLKTARFWSVINARHYKSCFCVCNHHAWARESLIQPQKLTRGPVSIAVRCRWGRSQQKRTCRQKQNVGDLYHTMSTFAMAGEKRYSSPIHTVVLLLQGEVCRKEFLDGYGSRPVTRWITFRGGEFASMTVSTRLEGVT